MVKDRVAGDHEATLDRAMYLRKAKDLARKCFCMPPWRSGSMKDGPKSSKEK
jgi:hypothetical protein